MRRVLRVLAVTAATLAASIATAQQPPPARDRPAAPATGTARIAGRVIDGHTGLPVSRARVQISLAGPGGPRPPVATDESGAFAFTALPAGTYALNANKTGYLGASYPQAAVRTMRRMAQQRLTVTDGQAVDGITIPLYRGAVIAGRVTDARSEPAENVQVQTFFLPPSGKGKPEPRGTTMTNDLGEFRVAHLSPGSYVLLAQQRNMGGQADDPVESQPVPTYFPGVTSIDQAQRIALERDQTAAGVEIMMFDGAATLVTGTVVDAAGQPVNGGSLSVGQSSTDGRGFSSFGAPIRPDGTFRVRLPQGEYDLEARGRPTAAGPPRPGTDLVGMAHLSANGAPVSGLTIALGPPASISGRFVFDGESAPPQPEQLRVAFGSPTGGGSCRNMMQADVKSDWTFRVDGVIGNCVLRLNGSTGRWTLKAAMHDDVDMQERPTLFEPGQQLKDVQVVLTDRRTELVLRVVDEHGVATREYVALVFPADKARWENVNGPMGSRYTRAYMPPQAPPAGMPPAAGTQGLSVALQRPDSITALPPGEYFVVAVDDIGVDQTRDPETFERLAGDATRVTLTDRGPVTIDLRRKSIP